MKLIAKIAIFLFITLLLLALFAPSLLSTQVGKHAFLRFLKKTTGYTVSIETLRLRWTAGQQADTIEVKDLSGEIVCVADSIASSAPLWKIVLYHDLGLTHIISPALTLHAPSSFASRLIPPTPIQAAGFIPSVSAKCRFDR